MDIEAVYWTAGFAAALGLAAAVEREHYPFGLIGVTVVLLINTAVSLLIWLAEADTSFNGAFFTLCLATGATVVGVAAGFGVGTVIANRRDRLRKP